MNDLILFNTQSAGNYLGGDETPISRKTLERWRLEGFGPTFVKIGKAVRYRKEDLDDFISSGVVSTMSNNLRSKGVNNG